MAKGSRGGRPPGRKNIVRDVVIVDTSRCERCGSTDREPYSRTVSRAIAGSTRDGRGYNQVVWRSTACRACGQARVDVSFEMTF